MMKKFEDTFIFKIDEYEFGSKMNGKQVDTVTIIGGTSYLEKEMLKHSI